MERYKYVCSVVIGEKQGQSVHTSSRCVWDEAHDSFACESFENKSLYCAATVYGLYAE